MKKNIIISILALLIFAACDEPVIEKPENLIKKNQMIDMLVDVHLAEAIHSNSQRDSSLKNVTSADFYYSVLDKYKVSDTIFEKSYIYYLSNPKDFERMYRKVQSRLSEMEQEYSGRKNELLEFEDER